MIWSIAFSLVLSAASTTAQRTPQQLELEARLEQSARESNSVASWNDLAHFRFRIADYPGALSALDSAERIAPRQAYAELLRGAIAEVRLEYSDALLHYRESNARDPEHKMADAQLEALESWLVTLESVTEAHERVGQRLSVTLVGWSLLVLLALAAQRKLDRQGAAARP